jgi:hypothetical protein
MNSSALGRILVPGSMPPKPLASNRGHARATVGRADGYVGYFRGARGPRGTVAVDLQEIASWHAIRACTRSPITLHLPTNFGDQQSKKNVNSLV